MPIIDLQKRMRQLGEIRIGHTVETGSVSQNTGRPIRRPAKLDRFRLTSASRPLLEQVAQLYGGQVQEWVPANGGPTEWEVYTETDRLPIIIPPRNAVSQWYELYQGSRCVRRCDGEVEQKSDSACLCARREERDCSITTRINIMLRDVQGIGVWLLTTHGYFAATELPDVAEFLSRVGGYVDAWLSMEEKSIIRASGQPARFMVPKLDVGASPAQLLSGEGSIQIGAPRQHSALGVGTLAIEAGAPVQPGQVKQIGLLMNRTGMDAATAEAFVSDAVGRPVSSSRELTSAEAEMVIKALMALPTAEQEWQALCDAAPHDWSIAEMEQAFERDHQVSPAQASVAQVRVWGEQLVDGGVQRPGDGDHPEGAR